MCLKCDKCRLQFEEERRKILTDALPQINDNVTKLEDFEIKWSKQLLAEINDGVSQQVEDERSNRSYCWWIQFRYTPEEEFIVIENKLITLKGYWWTTSIGDPITSIRKHDGCFNGFLFVPLCYNPDVNIFGQYIALQCFKMFKECFLPILNNNPTLEFTAPVNLSNNLRQWYGQPIPRRKRTDFHLLNVDNPRLLETNDLFRLLQCFDKYCTIFIEYLTKFIKLKDTGIGSIPGQIGYIQYYYFLYFLFVTRPESPGEALNTPEYKHYNDLVREVQFFRNFITCYDNISNQKRPGCHCREYCRLRTVQLFYMDLLTDFQRVFFQYVDKESVNGLADEVDEIWNRRVTGLTIIQRLTIYFCNKLNTVREETKTANKQYKRKFVIDENNNRCDLRDRPREHAEATLIVQTSLN